MGMAGFIRSVRDALFLGACATAMKFDGAVLTVTGDKLPTRTIAELEAALRSAGLREGTIRITQNGRIFFAKIDENLHQQLRNILNNA